MGVAGSPPALDTYPATIERDKVDSANRKTWMHQTADRCSARTMPTAHFGAGSSASSSRRSGANARTQAGSSVGCDFMPGTRSAMEPDDEGTPEAGRGVATDAAFSRARQRYNAFIESPSRRAY